jgi:transcriptional regulator with GAF, ATPase, and Fis domain
LARNNNINELEFFRECARNICGSLSIEISLSSCLSSLRKVIPAYGLSVDLYREDSNDFQVLAIATPEGAKALDLTFKLPPELRVVAEWHEKSNMKIIGDPRDDPVSKLAIEALFPYFRDFNLSTLVMRLNLKDSPRVADVCLFAKGINRLNASHAHLFSMLNDPFAIAVANFLVHRKLRLSQQRLVDDRNYLREEMIHLTGNELIGASTGLRNVAQMARHVAPLDSPVLLTGETGVGKEVVANAIQQNSGRREGPFVKVNCGAIPESLLDSELFGHEKGSFTGAMNRRRGRFELASGGTIFLDEIGEMPPSVQIRLLRVLQDGTFDRLGGTQTIKVDIRVIAATHRFLPDLIKAGRFRQDLFFRLNIFPIHIPSLRERRMDIPTLVRYFIQKKCLKMNRSPITDLAEGTVDLLLNYDWPGNVRELENIVERSLILHKSGALSILPPDINQSRSTATLTIPETTQVLPLDTVITTHIKAALHAAGGKIQGRGGAAELLQINPNTLRKRMQKLNIPFGRPVRSYA